MLTNELIQAAKKINLRYVADSIEGIKRLKKGKDFTYVDPNGTTIYNQNTLERIKALGIPPAWTNVWISPLINSHLQATGFDKKTRKQYIYHPRWIELSNESKFSKLIDFAKHLPDIREFTFANLKSKGLGKKKVLATIVWLLENTFIRVGNDEYVKENNSFGLTTLRSKHVAIKGFDIKFQFKGKSGIEHLVTISHPVIAKTIKRCNELPGYELFKCIDENGNKHIIDSGDVNQFLKEITGEETTAKEFRTWGGTVLAAINLHKLGYFFDKKTEKNNIALTAKTVAKHLRNTPKVCLQYYIHPTVIKTYSGKILIPHFDRKQKKRKHGLTKSEYKVFTLLQRYS